jgi:protein-S-isoprenylcysteine O-methyltransferase Ste14
VIAVRTIPAVIGAAVWFGLAPGVVAGLVPWLITGWSLQELGAWWLPMRVLGGVLAAVGVLVLVHAFVRFVTEGRGTPVPIAPPMRLVVGGLYSYVRNPMYVAVEAVILGQALLLARLDLVMYAAVVALVTTLFVVAYEEPELSRRFGADYAEYRRRVGRWLPRLRPWRPKDIQ